MDAMTMAWRKWLGIVLVGGVATLGCSVIVDNELSGNPSVSELDGGVADEFCRGRVDGTDCSTADRPDHICLNFHCVESRCGDGYVDEDRGEECDLGDGNNTHNSGCEPDCTITCHVDEDCDDGNVCTGGRICTSTNRCISDPTEPIPADNTPCTLVAADADGGITEDGWCCELECQEEMCAL